MQETVNEAQKLQPLTLSLFSRFRAEAPSVSSLGVALLSAILLILSFPDFDISKLAWIGLVPLLVTVTLDPRPVRSFLLGWFSGTVFFYVTCYWLTFSMINYGGIPPVVAYLLLVPGALTVGIFPGFFTLTISIAVRVFRTKGLFLGPLLWPSFEYLRLLVTGQLWNALGYSQAYEPSLIQAASWGGVYAVSFLIVAVNCLVAFVVVERTRRAIVVSTAILLFIVLTIFYANGFFQQAEVDRFIRTADQLHVLALQPNVPMSLVKSDEEMQVLTARHVQLSERLLSETENQRVKRLLVWPESPMNFEYARNAEFRSFVTSFAREHQTAVLFNSQEPAPNNGIYNSAMLINEDGELIGQYDKIRLLPFGEYVPLPRWLPGANLIGAVVGDFTPGANYTMFRVGNLNTGVFICVESAYPSIAREFSRAGADVLINISNDGYLGRTAVMKQHLANAVFRAVENQTSVLRVTNTGITAFIDGRGRIYQQTAPFEEATRDWTVFPRFGRQTFYTRHGDLFVKSLLAVSVLVLVFPSVRRLRLRR